MKNAKKMRAVTHDKLLVRCIICGNIIKALVVRCLMVGHGLVCVWQAVETVQNQLLWLLSLVILLMIAETFYRLWKRRGVENRWFFPAFLIFLFLAVPPIWILQLRRAEEIAAGGAVYALTDSLSVNKDLVVFLLEQGMLLLLIFGRWIVPKPERDSGSLAKVLLSFIAIAGDMIIFFDMFTEPDVVADVGLRYGLLVVWSLSLLQFAIYFSDRHHRLAKTANLDETFRSSKKTALEISKNTGKSKVYPMEMENNLEKDTVKADDPEAEIVAGAVENTPICDAVTLTVLLTIFTQELPYMVVRIYIVISKNVISFSVIFFLAKNALVILMFIYNMLGRIFLVFRRLRNRRRKRKDSETGNDIEDAKNMDGEKSEAGTEKDGK